VTTDSTDSSPEPTEEDDAAVPGAEAVGSSEAASAPGSQSASEPNSKTTWQRIRNVFYGTEARRVGFWTVIAGAIISLVLVLVFHSGNASKPATAASAAPKNAVEEIARRNIWTSYPAVFSTANVVAEHKEPNPKTEGGIERLSGGPLILSPAELAQNAETHKEESILVVGKVQSVQTVPTQFLQTELGRSEERAPTTATQVELAGSRNENAYVEIGPGGESPSVGGVIVARGEVAAVGETKGMPEKRSAYLLSEQAEKLDPETNIDSDSMRRYYREALKSSSTE